MLKRLAFISILALISTAALAQVRLKDIATIEGARGNQLIGYGIVAGLDGTGDSQSALFTVQSIADALQKFGVNVPAQSIRMKNVAAVMVTANLPPFARPGSEIDVTVSSIGDAKSLQGGTLLQTPLLAANGQVYAAAQGPISIGGFNVSAGGSSVQKNQTNVGLIPNGAYVEQSVPTTITKGQSIHILLNSPDFTTASRVVSAIKSAYPTVTAVAVDPGTVRVDIPPNDHRDLVEFVSQLELLRVVPDTIARIVVNERTGTVVIGGNVTISPCAVAHGNLHIQVQNNPIVAVPPPFSSGKPIVVPNKSVQVQETKSGLAAMPATTTVYQLVRALNALGVTPRDLIAILQTMQASGDIAATIEVQ